MKGLFPWIREALFGPPTPKKITCANSDCYNAPTDACGSRLCMKHHYSTCCTYTNLNKNHPWCHFDPTGRPLVDLAFLKENKS